MSVFDAGAPQWDKKMRRVELAKDVVSSIIKYAEPNDDIDIADFGTGTGLILLGLADYAKTMTGYDSSAGMLAVLDGKAADAGLRNLRTVRIDLEKDDFPPESADMMTSSMVIHHMDDPSVFFRKAYKALRKGGKLCVADLKLTEEPFHDHSHGDVPHGGFDAEEIRKLMTDCGFSDVQIYTAAEISKERDRRELKFPVFLAVGVK